MSMTTFDTEMAKTFGLNVALVFAAICALLARDGEKAPLTSGRVMELTTLTYTQQRKAINTLLDQGLIMIERRGLPAARYVSLTRKGKALTDKVTSFSRS